VGHGVSLLMVRWVMGQTVSSTGCRPRYCNGTLSIVSSTTLSTSPVSYCSGVFGGTTNGWRRREVVS